MAALDAIVQERMGRVAEERAAKQAAKVRLTADPNITVNELQECFLSFMRFKNSKNLWTLICPPPGGPATFSWHTSPNPEWLAKASNLLFDLVKIACNTKLQSVKVVKSLRGLYENRDLEFSLSKSQSSQDMLDKLDFTIRLLLNMVRTLKECSGIRSKVFRCLPKRDQIALDLVLGNVQLPLGLSKGESVEEDENKSFCMDAEPEQSLAIVPYAPSKTAGTKRKSAAESLSLQPMPTIFGKILGSQEVEAKKLDIKQEEANSEKKLEEAKQKILADSGMSRASTNNSLQASAWSDVLQEAMKHKPQGAKPKEAKAAAGKEKVQKVKACDKGKNAKKSPAKAKKVKQALEPKKVPAKAKKEKQTEEESKPLGPEKPLVEGVYKAGDYTQQRDKYIQEFLRDGAEEGATFAKASSSWSTSLKRARILSTLSLSELKRRRFVEKTCEANPFISIVAAQGEP